MKKTEITKFLNLVVNNIFTVGITDPMVKEINNWDTLFKYWDDFGNLSLHTKSDIIELSNQVDLSEDTIEYILGLPQISALERG